MKPPRLLLFIVISLFIFQSCKTTKKATATETATRYLPALPASQINVPVRLYMRPLLATMDSITSKEFTNEKWPNYNQSACDFRYKYRFVRSAFAINCTSNKVTIGFVGNYQIAGSQSVCALGKQVSPWINGSCGFGNEPLRKVEVIIGSLLEFLPNQQVRTTTRQESAKVIDKCEVTVLQRDVTPLVMDSIKASVNSYCTAFDNYVQVMNNNSLIRQWRDGGNRVMPISKYGYLNLNPTSLRIGKFNMIRDTLYFSIGFSGNPKFSSDSVKLINNTPLPQISNTENDGAISTYLDAIYEYGFFNKLLNDSLRNKPFEVEGRTFVIKDVNVSGTNEGKINVDVSFTGNKKGVLHLSGTPVLDSATQVLSMPDISFALDTKDMLVNIAKGLFKKKIMKQLQNQSVLDIAALIEKNKTLIEARLNQKVGPWIHSTGTLNQLKLVGILPQKDHIQIQAYINARILMVGSAPSLSASAF
jgi:uncharacterized protein DUF4403